MFKINARKGQCQMLKSWVFTLCSFVGKYGALFEDGHGPAVRHVRGTYELAEPGRVNRGARVPLPRAQRPLWFDRVRALSTMMNLFKMVLFADVLAALGQGQRPIGQVSIRYGCETLSVTFVRESHGLSMKTWREDIMGDASSSAFGCFVLIDLTDACSV